MRHPFNVKFFSPMVARFRACSATDKGHVALEPLTRPFSVSCGTFCIGIGIAFVAGFAWAIWFLLNLGEEDIEL